MTRQARKRCGCGERQAMFEHLASGNGSEWHSQIFLRKRNDLIRINSLLSNTFRQACRVAATPDLTLLYETSTRLIGLKHAGSENRLLGGHGHMKRVLKRSL